MLNTLFGTAERCSPLDPPVSAQEARGALLQGTAPAGLRVNGHLSLADCQSLYELPEDLTVASLDLSHCRNLRRLPDGLSVKRLNLHGCTGIRSLPAELSCYELNASDTELRDLPADLRVEYRLDLSQCVLLESLPENLKVGALVLTNCASLTALPEGLDVYFLNISGCAALSVWPKRGRVRFGSLIMRDCAQFHTLPDWLTTLSQLDANGCVGLTALPEGLQVRSWADLGSTGITALPNSMRGVRLRWRGVFVEERIVFCPETITAQEALNAPNAELRRVLIERMGYEAFLKEVRARTLHTDTDAGGERRLVHVPLEEDEPLVCLSVSCPSTGRRYMLRVPPTMRSCHQAAAWLAGFDNPDDYRPLMET